MGTCGGLCLARAQAAQRALGGDLSDFLGRIQLLERARDRVPVVALHGAIFRLRNGDGRHRAVGASIFADESVRVREDFVSGSGVERSAFAVLDARIEIERGFFRATRVVDAIGAGQGVDVFVIEIEIAGNRTELRRLGDSAERIFRGDLRQFQRRLHHAIEACAGKIAGVGAGRALSEEHAHANRLRSGFFQSLDLAETDERGEFIAFADHAFGGSSATGHGAADDILRDFRRSVSSFEFLVSS